MHICLYIQMFCVCWDVVVFYSVYGLTADEYLELYSYQSEEQQNKDIDEQKIVVWHDIPGKVAEIILEQG